MPYCEDWFGFSIREQCTTDTTQTTAYHSNQKLG
jgi:hypothetical protein